MENKKETETWTFSVEINQDHTPATLSKIAKLMSLSHIDGKIPPHEIKKAMGQHLEDYLKTTLGPFIGKPIFGSLVCGIGAPYLQVIEFDDDNNWCWDSIDFNGYTIFHDIQEKGAVNFLAEKLKKINHASYYLFCVENNVKPEYSGYSGDHIGLAKEALTERIISNIDATQNTYYQEGYEDNFMIDKFDSRIHKEEYLYALLDEAREEYEGTSDQEEDRDLAFTDTRDQWLECYPSDELLTEIFAEVKN